MKNRVHYKKEPKIELFCYQGLITTQRVITTPRVITMWRIITTWRVITTRRVIAIWLMTRNHNSTCNLPLVQGTVFVETDNANSIGMLSSSKGVLSKAELLEKQSSQTGWTFGQLATTSRLQNRLFTTNMWMLLIVLTYGSSTKCLGNQIQSTQMVWIVETHNLDS